MSPLFYAVGASGRENPRRGVNDFALQNYGKNFIYANLFAKKMPHSAWATSAFIEVRVGEYSKNRDGRG